MKRKIKWHKFKCRVKNLIRVIFVITVFLFFMCSLAHLMITEIKAIVTFVISLTMLVLFGVANKGVFL